MLRLCLASLQPPVATANRLPLLPPPPLPLLLPHLVAALAAYGPYHQRQECARRGWNLWPHRPGCLPHRDCECGARAGAAEGAPGPTGQARSICLEAICLQAGFLFSSRFVCLLPSHYWCQASRGCQPSPQLNHLSMHCCADRSPCKTVPPGRPPPEGSARAACGAAWTRRRATSSSDAHIGGLKVL